MDPFLKSVAIDLLGKHGANLHQLTLVFPNRRAGIFFTNYLNEAIDQPLIIPEITTINELFHASSDYFVPDRLNLIFRLYKVYQEVTSSKESFDDFYYWGGMLVSDFDQIDKYRVNARDLFTNITELKEIDERFKVLQPENKEVLENFWKTVLTEQKSPNQEEFIRLWKELSGIYEKYKALLHAEGLAYEGMVYRAVIDELLMREDKLFKNKSIVFVGFNALNKCEETLFEYLKQKGQASFYWDYDDYYLKDPGQEAGLFMRKNLDKFPQAYDSFDPQKFAGSKTSVKILNASSQISQAQAAGEEVFRLVKNTSNPRFDHTAVVLCDEELLLPVLSSLPDEAQKVNITMGYPMKMTAAYSLINLIIELQKNRKTDAGEISFYYKDILALLNNQLVLSICPQDCRNLADSIKTNNLIYLIKSQLAQNFLFQSLFKLTGTIAQTPDYFLDILKQLFCFWEDKGEGENALLVREYLFQLILAVNRLKEHLVRDGVNIFGNSEFISHHTFFRLLQQYLNEQVIPFQGEPVEGIQVMGILETRVLDFENLILLSVNDGIMPKVSVSGSFIPYNLRRLYGLPTIEEQNAMYAYYFYRLLQRAKDITFIYNSASNGLVTGEKSRYLYQLQIESPHQVQEISLAYRMDHATKKEITIPKEGQVLLILQKYLQENKPLSPSALDKYLTCSLQFYFKYVAGLKEPEEISEEVDPKTFGKLFHSAMENIYGPYVGKILEKNTIEVLKNDPDLIWQAIHQAFLKNYFKGVKEDSQIQYTGKNWLIFETLKNYISRVLDLDIRRAPFEIIGLEQKVNLLYPINDSNQIKLEGFIDRLDRVSGSIEILDYKTGKAELDFKILADLFDKENKYRNKAAFQTLVYSLIMSRNHPEEQSIKPGIFILSKLFEERYDPSLICKEIGNDPLEYYSIKDSFEEQVKSLLLEIFDPSIPFCKTTIEENCTRCAYSQLCHF